MCIEDQIKRKSTVIRRKKSVECKKKIPIGLQHVNKCAHMKYSINAAFQW